MNDKNNMNSHHRIVGIKKKNGGGGRWDFRYVRGHRILPDTKSAEMLHIAL